MPGYRLYGVKMAGIVVVTTTTASLDAAGELAASAVAQRLAACAQVGGPVRSTYRWQGSIEVAEEYTVLFKTTAGRADALSDHIRASHSYDVPEIVVTPVIGGDRAYLDWIVAETTSLRS